MKTKTSAAATVLLLAGVLAGCGGADKESDTDSGSVPSSTPSVTVDAADLAVAEASVLVLSDFPSGWEAEKPDDDDDEADKTRRGLAKCVGVPYEDLYGGKRASADSRDFVAENDDKISNTVAVLGDEEQAKSTFEIVSSEEYRDCARKELESRLADNLKADEATENLEVGDISVNEMSSDKYGDETTAFRITVGLSDGTQSIDVFLDYVIVRVGRAANTVTTETAVTAFDADDLGEYVKISTDRLAAKLVG